MNVQIQPWQLSGARTVPWRGALWWQRALCVSGRTSPSLPSLEAFNDSKLHEVYNSPENVEIGADCSALLIDVDGVVNIVQGPNKVAATNVLTYSLGTGVASSHFSAA